MSFRVNPNPTFTTTAIILVPSDDGPEKRELKVRFRLQSDDARPTNEDGGSAFLRDAVDELYDLVDEAGKPIAYTTDVLDRLIRWPFVRTGLLAAYYRALNGAVLGN